MLSQKRSPDSSGATQSKTCPTGIQANRLNAQKPDTKPKPPICPSLPRDLGTNRKSRRAGEVLIAQNKPNSKKPKTNATSYVTKTYNNIQPRPTQKNKPNQTQFPGANMRQQARSVSAGVSPKTEPSPIRNTRYAICNTTYDIRYPKHDILSSLPKWHKKSPPQKIAEQPKKCINAVSISSYANRSRAMPLLARILHIIATKAQKDSKLSKERDSSPLSAFVAK